MGWPFQRHRHRDRWEQARWLLHDHTVKPEDRLAGLLVLLYAQWPAAISRLTVDHIDITDTDITDNEVRLRLGEQPIVLPEPLTQRLRQRGLHPGQARSTALFQLATELPAALLARMPGYPHHRRLTAPAAATGPPTPPTSADAPEEPP
jgi:hypothetical protein